jgi:hypothetical protein
MVSSLIASALRPGLDPTSDYKGLCDGRSATGASFLRVLQFPLPILMPLTSSYLFIILGWYDGPTSGWRTKWAQSHPTPWKTDVTELKSGSMNWIGLECRRAQFQVLVNRVTKFHKLQHSSCSTGLLYVAQKVLYFNELNFLGVITKWKTFSASSSVSTPSFMILSNLSTMYQSLKANEVWVTLCKLQKKDFSACVLFILSRIRGVRDYRQGLDLWIDFLTTHR